MTENKIKPSPEDRKKEYLPFGIPHQSLGNPECSGEVSIVLTRIKDDPGAPWQLAGDSYCDGCRQHILIAEKRIPILIANKILQEDL